MERALTTLLKAQLARGEIECVICLSRIQRKDAIWSCTTCYKLVHWDCSVSWATTARGNDFRCPACNVPSTHPGTTPTCFCGKVQKPFESEAGESAVIPNSCGRPCARVLHCGHPCVAVCHPGPCPKCLRQVEDRCFCTQHSFHRLCADTTIRPSCQRICQKPLDCSIHLCQSICHDGECSPCEDVFNADCYCGARKELKTCASLGVLIEGTDAQTRRFSCGAACSKKLPCGEHECTRACHPGECIAQCPLSPNNIQLCNCGKTRLDSLPGPKRERCTDPIPSCEGNCEKLLPCGLHRCLKPCHSGDCGPCEGTIMIACPCGKKKETIRCAKKNDHGTIACNTKCTTLRSCGRHQCSTQCCSYRGDSRRHDCPLVCDRPLRCGNHKCEALCHKGRCPPCLIANFDEVACNCGVTVMYPPIPCGTRLNIQCTLPCRQPPPPCGHPPSHLCHSGDCPPCEHSVAVECYSGHLTRNFPCYKVFNAETGSNKSFSCGLECGVQLLNCHHTCVESCHVHGENEQPPLCKQLCRKLIPHCPRSHTCIRQCSHNGQCVAVERADSSSRGPCQALVAVSCKCGSLKESAIPCYVIEKSFMMEVSRRQDKALMVECSSSDFPCCVMSRRKSALQKSMAGSREDVLEVSSASMLVNEFVTEHKSLNLYEADQIFDSVWLLDIPADIGNNEIIEFVRRYIPIEMKILRRDGLHSSVVERISADERVRLKSRQAQNNRFPPGIPAPRCRDCILFCKGRRLRSDLLLELVSGREKWLVPVILVGIAERSSQIEGAKASGAGLTPLSRGLEIPKKGATPVPFSFDVLEGTVEEPLLVEKPVLQPPIIPRSAPKNKPKGKAKEVAAAEIIEKRIEE
ncbi:hypothetical protein DFJ73DRAFT_861871 [Zopfochytrium polystomum]|nr:hypothetical protein DFJ73DRAFT_861871 [Zopfochytrium polystomum]